MAAPIIAHPLGLFDCCGVSDGAACAIVTTPAMAKKLGKKDFVTVKALQLALSSGEEMGVITSYSIHYTKLYDPIWNIAMKKI